MIGEGFYNFGINYLGIGGLCWKGLICFVLVFCSIDEGGRVSVVVILTFPYTPQPPAP